MGLLHGLRRSGQVVDLVVRALEGERLAAHQALDDSDRLLKAVDAHLRRVEGNPRGLVVGVHPAGADAELEAPVAQHVEGGGLFGQDRRMLVVVVEDQAADPQL